MKIGPLEFQEFAAKKPLTVTLDGAAYVTAKEVVANPELARSLPSKLPLDRQVQLTLDRLAHEPEFEYGDLNGALYSKADVMKHVRERTPLGRKLVRAEMSHCDDLIGGVLAVERPKPMTLRPTPLRRLAEMQILQRCLWLRMSNHAVFCECTTDNVTTPFANWRIANVHSVFASRGFVVRALTGADDVRAMFVPEATHALTVYLGGVGHGAYDLYTGHRPPGGSRDIILQVGHYATDEVTPKSIHLLSCETGRDLGPDTVAQGATSFGGYKENFNLIWQEGGVSRWGLFAQADAAWDLAMANGQTAQDAYNATVAAFNAAIATVPGTWTASTLTQDRNDLVLRGDPAAKISPHRWLKLCTPPHHIIAEKVLIEAGELYDDLPA